MSINCFFVSDLHGAAGKYKKLFKRIVKEQPDALLGSIALRRFIEKRQPLITLHGHIHESTRLTGSWRDKFNRTEAFNAAHDGQELSLVRFDPHCLQKASRVLL